VLGDVADLKRRYQTERSVFVEGSRLIPILMGLGATRDDLDRLPRVGDNLPDDPTLPFRKSRNGRFCYDTEADRAYRLEFQPFVLSKEDDFVRHDSGMVRKFAEIGPDLQDNTAAQALMIFKFLMIGNMDVRLRANLDYSGSQWILTLFHLRTVTTPELLGQPALEGVHSDGVDHTMTTLLDMWNPANDCATTQLHSWDEETGRAWNDATSPRVALRHATLLDTLILADNEFKHSVSPLTAGRAGTRATRDMLVLFTRRLTRTRHPSSRFESTTDHVDAPVEYVFEPSP